MIALRLETRVKTEKKVQSKQVTEYVGVLFDKDYLLVEIDNYLSYLSLSCNLCIQDKEQLHSDLLGIVKEYIDMNEDKNRYRLIYRFRSVDKKLKVKVFIK